MSFWEERKKEEVVNISSKAIDHLCMSFETIAEVYEEHLNRLPTLLELEQLIAYSLSSELENIIGGVEGKEVSENRIKLKMKQKKSLFRAGNILAIPLKGGTCFAYGEIKLNLPTGIYINYFNLVTPSVLTLKEFKETNPDYLITIMTGETAIVSGEWKIIGNIPREPNAYQIPDFFGNVMGKYYISYGEAINPSKRIFVEQDEAEKVKNPDGLFGYGIAAKYIEDLFFKEELKINAFKSSKH